MSQFLISFLFQQQQRQRQQQGNIKRYTIMDNNNTNTTKATINVISPQPIVSYEFPCSYLGTPRSITGFGSIAPSSSSPLGKIHRPVQVQQQQQQQQPPNTTSNSTTTTISEAEARTNNDELELLSCPYRGNIDGIASKTILESEGNIENLLSYMDSATIMSSLKNSNNSSPTSSLPMLAVEVWFTPTSQFVGTQDEEEGKKNVNENNINNIDDNDNVKDRPLELLPIVSIAAPVEFDMDENSNNDPCIGSQLVIGQRGEFLEIRYRDHFEYLKQNNGDNNFFDDDDYDDDYYNKNSNINDEPPQYSCRVLHLTQWNLETTTATTSQTGGGEGMEEANKIHHLVAVWKESGSVLQIYGNGRSIVKIDLLPRFGDDDNDDNDNTGADNDAGYDYDRNLLLRSFDPNYRLQLFSNSDQVQLAAATTTATANTMVPSYDLTEETAAAPADTAVVFSGMIHHVALYNQGLHEDNAVESLFHEGAELRSDPFSAFFEDLNNPLFEPLTLVASTEEQNNDGVSVTQGQSVTISVGGVDVSNSSTPLWDVMVELLEIPIYGELLAFLHHHNSKTFVIGRVGDRIPLEEGQFRTKLAYRNNVNGGEDYFSVPTQSYNGTLLPFVDLPSEFFSYRLVAVRKDIDNPNQSKQESVLLGWSDSVRQDLTIIHLNHPPTLQGLPEQVIQPDLQPSEAGSRPYATLGNNVALLDEVDCDIDRVRVEMWAYNGTLTIDLEDDVKKAMTLEITDCFSPSPPPLPSIRGANSSSSQSSPSSPFAWICNGKNDRNMTFLATPTDVSKILSNVQYNALNWNQSDTIVIHIFDGSGSPCLSDDEHRSLLDLDGYYGHYRPTTIRDGCFQSAAEIRVPAISRPIGHESRNVWSDHKSWWITLFMIAFFGIMSCCGAITCWRKFQNRRKETVKEDNTCSDHILAVESPESSSFGVCNMSEYFGFNTEMNEDACTDEKEQTIDESLV
jgi:hypothetical protein